MKNKNSNLNKSIFLCLVIGGIFFSSRVFAGECETKHKGNCVSQTEDVAKVCPESSGVLYVNPGLCEETKVCCVPKSTTPPPSAEGIVPCGNSSQSPCTLCHLIIGIKRLIDWGKNLLVTITFVGIFISGVMYIISAGEEAMTTQAKKFLSASLIGFTVTMAAWLIVNVAITWVASAKPDLGIGKTGGWSTFSCDTTSSALTGGTSGNTGDPQKLAECNKWCTDNKADDSTAEGKKYNADCLSGCSSQFGPNGNPNPTGNGLSQSAVQQQLDTCGVKYANADALNGLRDTTITEACSFKNDSSCTPQITPHGGTNGNHSTTGPYSHVNGYKLDYAINSCLDNYIQSNYSYGGVRSDGAKMYKSASGACYAREGDHWDVSTAACPPARS